ncbi:MAG: glycosyltransferase involved in cell wall biosynthesis [Gammaproteobacteria bacterium]|jgi:glycosyltransferase involved in cell wall biosynthesis
MRILALEPFGAASHMAFLEGLARASRFEIEVVSLPPRVWKWRMRTAAMGMVAEVVEREPDLLFVSDFLNLAELRALLPSKLRSIPVVCYFHENQMTYPVREGERVDVHHGLTNIHSVLAAEHTLFNSAFHRDAFLEAARGLLARVPDLELSGYGDSLERKSAVLGLGTDMPVADLARLAKGEAPVLVWNHRWEYDKNPDGFLRLLVELRRREFPFRLLLLGERFRGLPDALVEIEAQFEDCVVASGFAPSRAEYREQLSRGHLLVSTSRHEFFGLSTLEGLCAGLVPVLPHDLAYPELLPEGMVRAPFLYGRAEEQRASGRSSKPDRHEPSSECLAASHAADAVIEASRLLASGEAAQQMAGLTEHLARFQWSALGPRFDEVFVQVASDAS